MNLGKEFINSSKFVLLGNYINVIVALGISIVLARLLEPAMFGIIAACGILISLLQLIGNAGFSGAIIQFGNKITKNSLSGLFSILFLTSCLATILFFFSANLLERLFDYNNLAVYLQLLSAVVFFSVMNGSLKALVINEKRFKELGVVTIFSTTISGVIGIILAFNEFGVYSLIYKVLIYHGSMFFCFSLLSWRRFSFSLSLTLPKQFWSYVRNGYYSQFIGYLMNNLDTILVAKFMGAYSLGLYDISYRFMRQPVANLAKVFTPVIQPIFNSIKDRREAYKPYSRFTSFMAQVGFILSLLIVLFGEEFFILLYGNKWAEAAKIFKVLSITAYFHILLSGVGGIMLALGFQKLLSKSITISFVTTISFIFLAVLSGDLIIVAYSYALAIFINFLQSFYYLYFIIFDLNWKKLAKDRLVVISGVYIFFYGILFTVIQLYSASLSIKFSFLTIGIAVSVLLGYKYTFWKEIIYILRNIR